MVEGGEEKARWGAVELRVKPALGGSAPSFRLSFYAAFPAPHAQVLQTVVIFHDASLLLTPEQLLQLLTST